MFPITVVANAYGNSSDDVPNSGSSEGHAFSEAEVAKVFPFSTEVKVWILVLKIL